MVTLYDGKDNTNTDTYTVVTTFYQVHNPHVYSYIPTDRDNTQNIEYTAKKTT